MSNKVGILIILYLVVATGHSLILSHRIRTLAHQITQLEARK